MENSPADVSQPLLKVGKIIKPRGVSGEMVVEPFTDFPDERFGEKETLFLETEDGLEEVTVTSQRWHDDRLLVSLDKVDDIETVEALREHWFMIPEAEKFNAENNSYYSHELIGFDVFDGEGTHRGQMTAIHYHRHNPVAEIQYEDSYMDFPLSDELIVDVDPGSNQIVLQFPNGWRKLLRSSD